MITHASTFSGIGAPEVAAEMLGWENVFHCEINPFGRRVLDYYFPKAKSYEDITRTDFSEWRDRIEEFKKHPAMVKLYIKGIQQYIDSHPNSKVSKYTAYEAFAHDVFFNEKGKWEQVNDRGLFDFVPDWKEFIEQQFNITL